MTKIRLDLPFPPSTNSIWRLSGRLIHRSSAYIAWTEEADMAVMAARAYPKIKITGPFVVEILLDQRRRGDGDNRIKAVLDWLQSRDIVRNDGDCQAGSWAWVQPGMAPRGCRVTVRSVE